MTYEELQLEAQELNINVRELPLASSDGRINGDRIAIRKDMTNIEKSCVLAEELGHFHTTSGNIVHIKNTKDSKQEHTARVWGYNKKIGLTGLINAFNQHCKNLYEMAEYLDVTEEYLKEALLYYHSKYGVCTSIDNYIIYFEPTLSVFESLKMGR